MKILRAIGIGVLAVIAIIIIANILFAVHKQAVARWFEQALSDTLALAEKSKDPEAIRVAKYLQENMSPALAVGVKNGRLIVRPLRYDGRHCIVTVPREFAAALPSIGITKRCAWYDSKTNNIYLVSEERATDMEIPITLLHEGEHALHLKGKGVVEVSISQEIAAYDLEYRVLEAVGGQPWKDAREEELSRLKAGKALLFEEYDTRLDQVFGPAKNSKSRQERQLILGDAATWYLAELANNPNLSKAKIVNAIYGGTLQP